MVTKVSVNATPPEIDESWWTAVLADEDKFNHAGAKEHVKPEELKDRVMHPGKHPVKTNEID
jgi:hypothetical protein